MDIHKCAISSSLVKDTCRFARNREGSIRYRRLLREHGVRVLSMADGCSDDEDEAELNAELRKHIKEILV